MFTLTRESALVKFLFSRRALDPLRRAARRLAAYHNWPVLHLAGDIVIVDRDPWLRFLRQVTDDELLYALRVLRARTRFLSPGEVA